MISQATNGSIDRSDLCAAIVNHFQEMLRRHVHRSCVGTRLESEVDDIVQESFARLWRALRDHSLPEVTIHNWTDEPHFERIRAKLFGMAKHVRLQFYRRMRRQNSLEGAADLCAPAASCPVVLREIEAALEECTPMQRDIFLRRQKGYSNVQIAANYGIPAETVRTTYFRVRERLQQTLEDYA